MGPMTSTSRSSGGVWNTTTSALKRRGRLSRWSRWSNVPGPFWYAKASTPPMVGTGSEGSWR